MPEIYLLTTSDIYSKVFELALNEKNISYKIIKDEIDVEELVKDAKLVIIDNEFNDDIEKYINELQVKDIPVIYLKDIFSEEKFDIKRDENFVVIEKPFEENDLLDAIGKFIDITPQKINGEKEMAEEKKVSQDEEVLELVDVVEEKTPETEVSDILSVKKEEKDEILDEFFNEEEQQEQQDIEREPLVEEVDDIEEEPKIPVDEETVELAKEIENGGEETFEKKVEIKEPERKEEVMVDVSKIEAKLLQATDKIMEAIENSTIEIARAIAKVTPKIIEEVAKEIIPAVAKRIISEEISKKEDED